MLFGNVVNEAENVIDTTDAVIGGVDDSTDSGIDVLSKMLADLMTESALEHITVFEGGEEAQKAYMESAEVQALVEARKMSKKTFVRLNKNDDFTRRCHLASLILARNANDPLFKKLAINRQNERKLRSAIFKKYEAKAKVVAKRSQTQHIKNMKKMPAMPKITF